MNQLKLYYPDGTAITRRFGKWDSPMDIRRDFAPLLKKVPGLDPRYGRIVDPVTGTEYEIRHSFFRGQEMNIVLKQVNQRQVVVHLASYDRRNLTRFYLACREADSTLADMAGLERAK